MNAKLQGKEKRSNELQRHGSRLQYEELQVRPDQPAFKRDGDGFRTALRVQLFEDRSHVNFDGQLADVKDCTDLLVAFTVGEILENLVLMLTELRVRHRFH